MTRGLARRSLEIRNRATARATGTPSAMRVGINRSAVLAYAGPTRKPPVRMLAIHFLSDCAARSARALVDLGKRTLCQRSRGQWIARTSQYRPQYGHASNFPSGIQNTFHAVHHVLLLGRPANISLGMSSGSALTSMTAGRRFARPVRERPPDTLIVLPIGHAAGTIIELSTCLQSTSMLSRTVVELALNGLTRSFQMVSVGFRCGQDWWSGSHARSKNTVKCRLTVCLCVGPG